MAVAQRPTEQLTCPFCPFTDTDSYILILHVEEIHTDDSPFVARPDPPASGSIPRAGLSNNQSPARQQQPQITQYYDPSANDYSDDEAPIARTARYSGQGPYSRSTNPPLPPRPMVRRKEEQPLPPLPGREPPSPTRDPPLPPKRPPPPPEKSAPPPRRPPPPPETSLPPPRRPPPPPKTLKPDRQESRASKPPLPTIRIVQGSNHASPAPSGSSGSRSSSLYSRETSGEESELSDWDKDDEDDDEIDAENDGYVLCTEPGCEEQVLREELGEHLSLHCTERLLQADEEEAIAAATALSLAPASKHTASSHSSSKARRSSGRPNRGSSSYSSATAIVSGMYHSFAGRSSSAKAEPEPSRKKLKRKTEDKNAQAQPKKKISLARAFFFGLDSSSPHPAKMKSTEGEQGRTSQPEREVDSLRLGRAELGPYAWEEQMPPWLYKQLEKGPKIDVETRIGSDGKLVRFECARNETPGIVPALAQLIELDDGIREAWLCHPSVHHVAKEIAREGGFCGYRNIQMLMTYINQSQGPGHEQIGEYTPTVLKIQDWIEDAWDQGIYEIGRAQTGGIKGTRKYIGTPEAHALFINLSIDNEVRDFHDQPDGLQAYEQLLFNIQEYFASGTRPGDEVNKVRRTHLPPIYLQQPGHSVTIVGLLRTRHGHPRLLVLDPMFQTPSGMKKLLGQRRIKSPRPEVLDFYVRKGRQLMRHKDFEILILAPPPSALHGKG